MAGRPTLEAIVLLLQLRRLVLACLALRSELPLILDKMRNMRASFSHSKVSRLWCICAHEGGTEVRVYSYNYGEALRKSARIYGVELLGHYSEDIQVAPNVGFTLKFWVTSRPMGLRH